MSLKIIKRKKINSSDIKFNNIPHTVVQINGYIHQKHVHLNLNMKLQNNTGLLMTCWVYQSLMSTDLVEPACLLYLEIQDKVSRERRENLSFWPSFRVEYEDKMEGHTKCVNIQTNVNSSQKIVLEMYRWWKWQWFGCQIELVVCEKYNFDFINIKTMSEHCH